MFDRFYQVDRGENRAYRGTGLGLEHLAAHRGAAQRGHLGRKRRDRGPRQLVPRRAAARAAPGRSADDRFHDLAAQLALASRSPSAARGPQRSRRSHDASTKAGGHAPGRRRRPVGVLREHRPAAHPGGCAAGSLHAGHPAAARPVRRYGARATFFVCGRDLPAQAATIARSCAAGTRWRITRPSTGTGTRGSSRTALRGDVRSARRTIADCSRPGAGRVQSARLQLQSRRCPKCWASCGYCYDSSRLPTFYAPAIRAMQRVLSQGQVDPTHYGRFEYGFSPLRPASARGWRPAARGAGHDGAAAAGAHAQHLRADARGTGCLTWGSGCARRGTCRSTTCSTPPTCRGSGSHDPALASYRFLTQTWEAKQPLYEHILGQLTESYVIVPTREFVIFGGGRDVENE